MNTPDFKTAKSEQYRSFRNRLIKLIDHVDSPVKHATELLGRPREDSLAITRDKLSNNLFSLVLIGAFQSGKSTLFNYLCDGRELSPVGPGGGGIRTSGCRVSAYPEEENAHEYAHVSWRSKAQLLRSFGSGLRVYYEVKETSANKVTYLTDDLIDLDKQEQREELAKHAWEEYNKKPYGSGLDTELMRFVLIVCEFYPQFVSKIQAGIEEWKVDDAVIVSSYPQDWESRWEKVLQPSDVLSCFKWEEVAFAFCGGVNFHLDSANLRNLGCVVSDCPGLFISEWDTEIAKTCIQEADAVLYQFDGIKALTRSDIEALEACVTLGGKHKLIFAANLKMPRNEWGRIEKDAVAPKLRRQGFDNPDIHAIHAGIALRGYEAMLHSPSVKALSVPSRSGIAAALRMEKDEERHNPTDENISWYLHKKLNQFVQTLTNYDETVEDYSIMDGSLDSLSSVTDMIQAANKFITDNKFESMLKHQGSAEIIKSLRSVQANLGKVVDAFEGDITEKRNQLESEQERLDDLRSDKNNMTDLLLKTIELNEEKIISHFTDELDALYENQATGRIMELFIDLKPYVVQMPFINRRERSQKFADGFTQICNDCFVQLRENVSQEFVGLQAYKDITRAFEKTKVELEKKFNKVSSIDLINSSMELQSNSFRGTADKMLPSQDEIMDNLLVLPDFWEAMWTILCFGINLIFVSGKQQARAFIGEYDNRFRKAYHESLRKAFKAKGAPMQIIRSKYDEFNQACDEFLSQCETQCSTALQALNEANSEEQQEKIKAMKAAITELEEYLKEAQSIQDEITAAAQS